MKQIPVELLRMSDASAASAAAIPAGAVFAAFRDPACCCATATLAVGLGDSSKLSGATPTGVTAVVNPV